MPGNLDRTNNLRTARWSAAGAGEPTAELGGLWAASTKWRRPFSGASGEGLRRWECEQKQTEVTAAERAAAGRGAGGWFFPGPTQRCLSNQRQPWLDFRPQLLFLCEG